MAIDKKPLELSADFKYALDRIEKEGRNVFITGRAGTGKSTLLQLFRNTTRRKAVVVAPTGIAALNVKGQTIHSFFGFPPRPLAISEIKKRRNRRLYQNMEVLVIDEISMVRADLLDNIDWFLRINRDVPLPFGGVQVVFFGDLFQLPPVVASDLEAMRFQSEYDSPYFFSARAMQEESFVMEKLEMQKVYRQENRHFLRLLEAVRLNRIDYDDLEDLNSRCLPHFEPEDYYITLSARNATVDAINNKELAQIPLPERIYLADVTGDFNPKLYPTDPALRLKLGAQVMFIKNDPDKQFVNGTIGMVADMGEETVIVTVEEEGQNRRIEVGKMEWEILRYKPSPDDIDKIDTETIGTFRQFPVKLAWAITIHKSQGKTFDRAIIDLGRGAFEHGQAYVALSRCRSLEGIVLKQPIRMQDIITDEKVVEYYESHF
ncbi:MAG: AAA family ATPase [Lewinellaceae bacterium]|nr:AAA family ATPase [Lewinellaceae bacterium]